MSSSETARCPTCGSDDPGRCHAEGHNHPCATLSGRAARKCCPDPFHSPEADEHERVYVAGRISQIERVREVQAALREAGHGITFDWTGPEGGQRSDWSDAPDHARMLSRRERGAVAVATSVVLVGHGCGEGEGGLGCFIEVGMAMAAGIPIYVIGPCRESVFWYLPEVTRVEDVNALIDLMAPASPEADEQVGGEKQRTRDNWPDPEPRQSVAEPKRCLDCDWWEGKFSSQMLADGRCPECGGTNFGPLHRQSAADGGEHLTCARCGDTVVEATVPCAACLKVAEARLARAEAALIDSYLVSLRREMERLKRCPTCGSDQIHCDDAWHSAKPPPEEV